MFISSTYQSKIKENFKSYQDYKKLFTSQDTFEKLAQVFEDNENQSEIIKVAYIESILELAEKKLNNQNTDKVNLEDIARAILTAQDQASAFKKLPNSMSLCNEYGLDFLSTLINELNVKINAIVERLSSENYDRSNQPKFGH